MVTYKVVAELPHDPEAFLQGLQYDRRCEGSGADQTCRCGASAGGWSQVPGAAALRAGPAVVGAGQQRQPCLPPCSTPLPLPLHRDIFWESTGLNGRSTVREVDLATGKVLRSRALPKADFGEGVTRHGDRRAALPRAPPCSAAPQRLLPHA